MRLQPREAQGILDGVEAILLRVTSKEIDAELILYGSRAHDDLKGGDIDLLMKIHDAEAAHALNLQKHAILAEVKRRIGDRRIDLSVQTPEQLEKSPFWQTALPGSVTLKKWESS